MAFSRREFVRRFGVGGAAVASAAHIIGYGNEELLAFVQGRGDGQRSQGGPPIAIRLSSNENLRGPSPKVIAALKALSDASGLPSDSRQSQCDIVLMAAALSGLAMFSRSGRLSALGFTPEEILGRLDYRFAP